MKLWSGVMMALLAFPVMAAELQSLDDGELSAVSGGDGIAVGWEYGVNTDASGNPLGTLNNCTTVGDVTATGGDRCRFAWQVAKRKDGSGNAAWTVAKNGWMSLSIPVLNLDVQSSMGSVGANPAYFDANRFTGYDAAGTGICLLTGGATNTCLSTVIDGLPAMKLYYPAASYNATAYAPGSGTGGTSSGFESLKVGLTIGRMAIEFDSPGPPITPGYMRDANTGSFLGAQIKDNNGNFAMMAIGGSALIYGF